MPETGGGEIRALEHSFNTMGSSLEASRDELIRLADEQSALRRVATLVANGVPAPELFSAVTEELGRLIGADIAAFVRLEPGNTAIVVGAWSDQEGNDVPVGTVIPLEGDTAATRLFRTGRPARSDNSDQIPGPVAALVRGLGVTSTVGTPIVVEGRLWGGISASSKQPEPLPTDTESRIADFAELVATAIANAEARTELAAFPARIVAASDEARRRLERDLHDGIQQRLVSLALTLRAAQATAPAELNELQARLSQVAEGLAGVLEGSAGDLARHSPGDPLGRRSRAGAQDTCPPVPPFRSSWTCIPKGACRLRWRWLRTT